MRYLFRAFRDWPHCDKRRQRRRSARGDSIVMWPQMAPALHSATVGTRAPQFHATACFDGVSLCQVRQRLWAQSPRKMDPTNRYIACQDWWHDCGAIEYFQQRWCAHGRSTTKFCVLFMFVLWGALLWGNYRLCRCRRRTKCYDNNSTLPFLYSSDYLFTAIGTSCILCLEVPLLLSTCHFCLLRIGSFLYRLPRTQSTALSKLQWPYSSPVILIDGTVSRGRKLPLSKTHRRNTTQ